MKTTTVAGVILVVIGIIALIYGGISYTTEEKVLDLGAARSDGRAPRDDPAAPVLGGLSLAGGIILLIMGARRC